jgi:type IV secretion system protein VirB11
MVPRSVQGKMMENTPNTPPSTSAPFRRRSTDRAAPIRQEKSTVVALHRDSSARHFLSVFDAWIDDNEVTEICVNGEGNVWVERNSKWECHECLNIDLKLMESLGRAIATFAKQNISNTSPLLSASLPDGSRMQFVVSPAVEHFPSFTMRKPSKRNRTLSDFEAEGLFKDVQETKKTLSADDLLLKQHLANKDIKAFFSLAVLTRKNIVVAGATGSGKTTFMKGLVSEIPLTERIITIEDVRELFLPQPNRVHLLYSKGGQGSSTVTPKELLESCLRMKPDRILLAEIRGDECLDYLQTAASGHPGSITSMHAGSPALAFERMAMMVQGSPAGQSMSFEVVKRLLLLTVDIIVQFKNESGNRFISEIYFNPEAILGATL